jgi:O-antigen/teichoic acid export membrane protein
VFLMFIYFTGFFLNIFDKKIIILLTLLIGLSLLIVNWLTNVLIASHNLVLLNRVNLISSILSVLSLPLTFYFGIFGGAFVILIQPTVFIILTLVISKTLRPSDFILNIIEIKKILHYGFIPFISGLFFLMYVQIERWSINLFLDTTALGSLYLFFLITALCVLVPTSIMNLFFPRSVAFYDGKKIFQFKKIIKLHFYIVIIYSVILILGLMIFLGPLVEYVFPQHTPYVKFVLYAIPGFVFRSLRDPISVFLNSVVKLKPMLYSDITSLSIYCMYIFILCIFDNFSLVNFIFGFNIYFIFRFITSYIPYKKLNSNLTNI